MKPEEFPIHCICGLIESHDQAVMRDGLKSKKHVARCANLSLNYVTVEGDWLACGCSRIYLYPCKHFDELVTLHAVRPPNKVDTAEDVRAAISDWHPEYRGRACQGCDQFAALTTPAPTD